MKEKLIKSVFDSRLLRTREEFETFEEGLEQLSELIEVEDMVELCKIFDDNTEMEEVMWGLVHFIEAISSKQWCDYMLLGLVSMEEKAPEWRKLVVGRALNHDQTRMELKEAYQNAEPQVRDCVKKVFQEKIEEDADRFAKAVFQVTGEEG